MDLWSISFVIENQFKNLFSEYVEDFEGYMSSSLFNNKKNNTKNVLPINIKNNLGEFHQNEFWTLEVLVQIRPDNNCSSFRFLRPWPFFEKMFPYSKSIISVLLFLILKSTFFTKPGIKLVRRWLILSDNGLIT